MTDAPFSRSADDQSVDDSRCESISNQDQERLKKDSGLDLAKFVEDSTRAMHSARTAEEQLRVIAAKFDHQRWSTAWGPGAVQSDPSERGRRLRDTLRLQQSLGHASLFLARYHRILQSGVVQEASALRAFRWDASAEQEIRREPVRALVQGFVPHLCERADTSQYGCLNGETIYRVKALLSPRVACRFPEKKSHYSAVFWVRVSGPRSHREARILEVEANGDRLVKMTYDDLMHKRLLSRLGPDVNETLIDAGLDPFRAPLVWRRLLQNDDVGRRPASR